MEQIYQAEYAGHPVRFAFLHPGTRRFFKFWLKPVDGADYDVKTTPEYVSLIQSSLIEKSAEDYAEYKALITPTSDYLLQFRCCIFHAVAFLWRERAWVLTAPSGTGKTTQFMNWRKLHPGEITMICGDLPILEQRSDGSVRVHSSNWNGKEGVGNNTSALLGGLILLEQGRENRIGPLDVRDSAPQLLCQFAASLDHEKQIRTVCDMLDAMLRRYPTWKYVNLGDDASTELLRSVIAEEMGEINGTV